MSVPTVVEARAGDLLVHKRRQFKMLTVPRSGDWSGTWFDCVSQASP